MKPEFNASGRFHILPRWAWMVAGLIALAGGFTLWHAGRSHAPSGKGFVEVYSFKPEVSATTYDSKKGNATVIWLSGLDESPSLFGEIWNVYSFKPEISATAYESPNGNATVIWTSGMDGDGALPPKPSS